MDNVRTAHWDDLLQNVKKYLKDGLFMQNNNLIIIGEQTFNYNKIKLEPNNNFYLFGYFQSFKYFQHNYEYIYNLLDINKHKQNTLEKINEIEFYDNIISMHFRLGDYKKIQNCHPLMTSNYYINCLDYLSNYINLNNYKVLYFCENDEEDKIIVKDI